MTLCWGSLLRRLVRRSGAKNRPVENNFRPLETNFRAWRATLCDGSCRLRHPKLPKNSPYLDQTIFPRILINIFVCRVRPKPTRKKPSPTGTHFFGSARPPKKLTLEGRFLTPLWAGHLDGRTSAVPVRIREKSPF